MALLLLDRKALMVAVWEQKVLVEEAIVFNRDEIPYEMNVRRLRGRLINVQERLADLGYSD